MNSDLFITILVNNNCFAEILNILCLDSFMIYLQAVLNLQVPVEHSKEVNDCKHLIKTLVMGNYFP